MTVEVHGSRGLPGLSIVGLPDRAVTEAKERVRSALATGHLDPLALDRVAAIGELALDGTLRSVPGALPIGLALRGRDDASCHIYTFV